MRLSLPRLLPALALAALLAAGCGDLPGSGSEEQTAAPPRAPGVPPPGEGLATAASARSVAAVTERLKRTLQQNEAVSIVADIDHAANAGGDSLRPMRLLLFGNPALGTPLMKKVQAAGIDLPQKMLVWQGADDSTRITYNAPVYLKTRHDLAGVDSSLSQMGRALAGLAAQAAGRPAAQPADIAAFNADSIAAGAGLVIETSDFGFDDTFRRLEGAVQARPGLSVMAQLDHAANAATVGDTLRPTRLLVVGNPAAGTPLLRQAPTLGIDLPQKLLVYEDARSDVFVVYNDPAYLARRHALRDTTGPARIRRLLDGLAQEATAGETERRAIEEARRDSSGVAY